MFVIENCIFIINLIMIGIFFINTLKVEEFEKENKEYCNCMDKSSKVFIGIELIFALAGVIVYFIDIFLGESGMGAVTLLTIATSSVVISTPIVLGDNGIYIFISKSVKYDELSEIRIERVNKNIEVNYYLKESKKKNRIKILKSEDELDELLNFLNKKDVKITNLLEENN